MNLTAKPTEEGPREPTEIEIQQLAPFIEVGDVDMIMYLFDTLNLRISYPHPLITMVYKSRNMSAGEKYGIHMNMMHTNDPEEKNEETQMNLTTEQLQQIIQEELNNIVAEKASKRSRKRKRKKVKKKAAKKDACYRKVKSRYKVWPSAYASGALVKCRKVGAKNWGNKSKKNESLNEDKKETPLQKVKAVLKKEGGAAGLDLIAKETELSKKEVNDIIDNNKDILIHKDGDVVEMTGLKEAKKKKKKKKKSAKDRMKCNKSRRIRKGEPGHGKKKFVVKACQDGTEKIIRYGDAKMEIKKDSPKRRKSFRARHNCKNPGSKLKARYWSCKKW